MSNAIHLAYLAEQACEFETDKQINVIRFDYDQSEVGNFLAGDFLMRDLDTLEQDLIVNQRARQQEVRHVLSLAREFPEALQELRDNGKMTFSLVLEQIERRFPGLFNARLGAVDVLPVALMDSTRFSLELTQTGSGTVRLPEQPGDAPVSLPANVSAQERALETSWRQRIRMNGPETAIFSGLSRQEANSVFPFMSNGRRNAFEGRPAASTWQLDLSMRENQVVPGTLADLLITFTLSGYYDSGLRTAQEKIARSSTVLTKWISARQTFPDAYYEFNRTGKMNWNVTADQLTLTGSAGRLRNLGVLLLPAPRRIQFGRLQATNQIDFRIQADGTLDVLSEIPEITFVLGAGGNPLQLSAQVTLRAGAQPRWDFGDGKRPETVTSAVHIYDRPGNYEITLRVVRNGRLTEFKAEVALSRTLNQQLKPPVTAFPRFTKAAGTATPLIATVDGDVVASWKLNGQDTLKGNEVSFAQLAPGDYTLFYRAMRKLNGRVYANQRFLPEESGLLMESLNLTSNRRFNDQSGVELPNPSPTLLTKRLFPDTGTEISPVDDWVFELTGADNQFLQTVSNNDVLQNDFSSLQDLVLALEYEVH